jgi:hypothetical protein
VFEASTIVSETQDGVGKNKRAAIILMLILPWVKYRSAIVIEDALNVRCIDNFIKESTY